MKIDIPDSVLDDLKKRLEYTRIPDAVPNAGWSMGTDISYIKELVEYWQKDFDWRKQEKKLNEFNHFTTIIDGQKLHFIHQKSEKENAPAVLLLHGWPDSFYRFYKVLPLLAKNYDVIVPSLPGFGFSGHTALSSEPTAHLLEKLMVDVLGYTQYAVAGGDISMPIVYELASQHAESLNILYLTDAGYPNGTEDFSTLSAPEQQFVGQSQRWWYMEGAYNMEQSTKPQTLGFGLNDSPVGLAAWIIEKFHAWSGAPKDIEKLFTKDELLTNITIYWITETIASSMRTYLENTRAAYMTGMPKPLQKTTVPAAFGSFPNENVPTPREWAERTFNAQRFTSLKKGGHFAALEEPELFASDITAALEEL